MTLSTGRGAFRVIFARENPCRPAAATFSPALSTPSTRRRVGVTSTQYDRIIYIIVLTVSVSDYNNFYSTSRAAAPVVINDSRAANTDR